MTSQPTPRRSTEELLASVRARGSVIQDEEVGRMRDVRDWALANTVDEDSGDEATIYAGRSDTGLPLAGDGAPLVSEFAVMELCALLGRSSTSGRDWVGKVLEVCFRLPGVWAGVQAGRVVPWRALCIAERTRLLSAEAVAHVDRQLAEFAATCTWAQVDRLVEEALARFDPGTAEQRRRDAAEGRKFDVDTGQVSFDGTIRVEGELDLGDGIDLDTAIRRRAQQLGELGCEESLDVRRSMAAGEIARQDLSLDLPTDQSSDESEGGFEARTLAPQPPRSTDAGPFQKSPSKSPGRKVELVVHLTDLTLAGDPAGGIARCGNTNSPISAEQVKAWCAAEGTTVIVRPVIDLAGHEPIEAYEIPDRHRRQAELRDPTCRFPHCTRRAGACDLDHAVPHAAGGSTCPCNLVPLCRSHHRAKTHTAWAYVALDPGAYLWTSPGGYQYLVDHRGTRDLSDQAVVSRLASSHLHHRVPGSPLDHRDRRWLRCEERQRRASKPPPED